MKRSLLVLLCAAAALPAADDVQVGSSSRVTQTGATPEQVAKAQLDKARDDLASAQAANDALRAEVDAQRARIEALERELAARKTVAKTSEEVSAELVRASETVREAAKAAAARMRELKDRSATAVAEKLEHAAELLREAAGGPADDAKEGTTE